MKKLLFIDHPYHRVTKSTEFLLKIIENDFIVSIAYYDYEKQSFVDDLTILDYSYDILVLFQQPIDPNYLKSRIDYRKAFYIPMFDSCAGCYFDYWRLFKDFKIISFSKVLHQRIKKYGLDSVYVQYFPKPIEINTFGDPKSVFLWQRVDSIRIEMLIPIFIRLGINNIHIHNCADPGHTNTFSNDYPGFNITISDWYEDKSSLLSKIQESAFFVAPRPAEGIGMSFLEAMAMGRCVLALDYPTMNEYIVDQKTGILFSNAYSITEPKSIEQIQINAYEYISSGYEEWNATKKRIISVIDSGKPVTINKILFLTFKIKSKLSVLIMKSIKKLKRAVFGRKP